jgi:hypothetical protein
VVVAEGLVAEGRGAAAAAVLGVDEAAAVALGVLVPTHGAIGLRHEWGTRAVDVVIAFGDDGVGHGCTPLPLFWGKIFQRKDLGLDRIIFDDYVEMARCISFRLCSAVLQLKAKARREAGPFLIATSILSSAQKLLCQFGEEYFCFVSLSI